MRPRTTRSAIVCLLLLAHAHALAADPPATITLAAGEWPPHVSAGLANDGEVSRRVTAAFAHEGIKVRYEFMPWKRALEETRGGRFDGTILWARTPSREADFVFSEPILVAGYMLFYARTRPVHWQALEDLAGLTIGSTLGARPSGRYGELERKGVFVGNGRQRSA